MIKASFISVSAALVAAAALGGASLAACSSSSSGGNGSDSGTTGDSPTGGDTGVKTDSSPGGDSAPTDSGTGGETASDSPVGTPFYGYVGAAVSPNLAGMGNSYTISALFSTSAAVLPGQAPCTGMMMGSCCYTPAAAPVDAGGSDAGPAASPQAGIITVTMLADAGTAMLTPDTMTGAYASDTMQSWNAGTDILMISAAGDTASVHAFSGSLQTGAPFANLMPAFSFAMPTMIDRTMDFPVTWMMEGMGGEKAVLFVLLSAGTMSDGLISCSVDESTGTITVPKGLLGLVTLSDTATLFLQRGIPKTPTTPADNATIYLIGGAQVLGSATFL